MTNLSTQELSDFCKGYQALIDSQQTLLLSTASRNGAPDISYAPCVRDQTGVFYIYVSELATHTVNLLENPRASIMFIRPESESKNPFARERVVVMCGVIEVFRDDPGYTTQLNSLQAKFGETVGLLRSLSDFHLFALHPQSGRYVVGFGRAFNIDVNDGSLSQIQR